MATIKRHSVESKIDDFDRYYPGVLNDRQSYAHIVQFQGGGKEGIMLITACWTWNRTVRGKFSVKGEIRTPAPNPRAKPDLKLTTSPADVANLHGMSGVYYYMRHISSDDTEEKLHIGRPHVYAGQARHLGNRALDPKRISNKDIVILIGFKNDKNSDDLLEWNLMDETWRQHLEYLMIKNLYHRSVNQFISVENKKNEHASLTDLDKRHKIEDFFNAMQRALEPFGVWGLSNNETYRLSPSEEPKLSWCKSRPIDREFSYEMPIDKRKSIQEIIRGTVKEYSADPVKRSRKEDQAPFFPEVILVLKDSQARDGFSGIDVTKKLLKAELMKKGVLKLQHQVLSFTEDTILHSSTEFNSIVFGKNVAFDWKTLNEE